MLSKLVIMLVLKNLFIAALLAYLASLLIILLGQLFITDDWTIMRAIGTEHWAESAGGEILGFLMYVVLCIYMYRSAIRIKDK